MKTRPWLIRLKIIFLLLPTCSVRSCFVESMKIAFSMLVLVRSLGLHAKFKSELERYFARLDSGYRCLICGKTLPCTEYTYANMIAHLFEEHPDKFYSIEASLLDYARLGLSQESMSRRSRVLRRVWLSILRYCRLSITRRVILLGRNLVRRYLHIHL